MEHMTARMQRSTDWSDPPGMGRVIRVKTSISAHFCKPWHRHHAEFACAGHVCGNRNELPKQNHL